MNTYSALILFIVLSIVTAYLWYIRTKQQEQWWSAVHTLLSVFVSVVVGLGVGLLVFQWEADAERVAMRKDLVALVDNELGVIEVDLAVSGKSTFYLKDTAIVVVLTVLPSAVLHRAGTSGVFTSHESWTMLTLNTQIDKHNAHVENLTRLVAGAWSQGLQRRILNIHKRITMSQSIILNRCDSLRSILDIRDNEKAKSLILQYDME